MVTTQAAAFSAWAAYESVLLDPKTATFFAARLSDVPAAEHSDGEPNPPLKKKKRKLSDDGSGSGEEADDDPVAVICEHCAGGLAPRGLLGRLLAERAGGAAGTGARGEAAGGTGAGSCLVLQRVCRYVTWTRA
jgi:hypothetical protein